MQPWIYNGANGDDTSAIPILRRITVASNGGGGFCRTGQTSGKSCGWRAISDHATFCSGEGCVPGTDEFDGGDYPKVAIQAGLIYLPYQSGALIAGTIIGSSCVLILC